jgi:hypothetical protein
MQSSVRWIAIGSNKDIWASVSHALAYIIFSDNCMSSFLAVLPEDREFKIPLEPAMSKSASDSIHYWATQAGLPGAGAGAGAFRCDAGNMVGDLILLQSWFNQLKFYHFDGMDYSLERVLPRTSSTMLMLDHFVIITPGTPIISMLYIYAWEKLLALRKVFLGRK